MLLMDAINLMIMLNLREDFEVFLRGQTVARNENGDSVVYLCDIANFLNKYVRGKELFFD